eukprot:1189649-Pleurochrysis_carterae.AAC.1
MMTAKRRSRVQTTVAEAAEGGRAVVHAALQARPPELQSASRAGPPDGRLRSRWSTAAMAALVQVVGHA